MATPRKQLDETDASRLQTIFVRLSRFVREQNPSGLPMTAASLFSTVEAHPDATLGQLAILEGVAPPTITRLVGVLEERGLVERVADVVDGRVSRVRLTRLGVEQHATWRAEYLEWFDERLAALPAEERSHLVRSIDALERLVLALRHESV
jgi:DNA-binding MarR family transcriptional regulator